MNNLTLNTLAMWMPGTLELTVILLVVLLIFGKRLPEIARGIGRTLLEFKKGIKEVKDVKDSIEKDVKEAG